MAKTKEEVTVVFDSAEKAAEKVEGRKRVFKCVHGDSTVFAVAANPTKAAAAAYWNLGGTVTATGTKALTPAAILEAITALPDDQKEELMAVLKPKNGHGKK